MMTDKNNLFSRRKFVGNTLALVGAGSMMNTAYGFNDSAATSVTVQQIIDTVTKGITVGAGTVDTLKAGKADTVVTGIVTTMFATVEVIRKAIDLKSNFIIAHEPTFYNHTDDVNWLQRDEVYRFKRDLLEQNNIAVWRLHDYIHSFRPDGVLTGVLQALGWEKYYDPSEPRMVKVPPLKLGELISLVKEKLSIETLRFIGDRNQVCERIAVFPGASGGRGQIGALSALKPDVMICGEVAEWETSEYIRDAQAMGRKQSLVVLGHARSEQPGMRWLKEWLQPKYPDLKITHIPSGSPFSFA